MATGTNRSENRQQTYFDSELSTYIESNTYDKLNSIDIKHILVLYFVQWAILSDESIGLVLNNVI